MAKIKYHTWQNPPIIQGQLFTEPSLTRQSDNMDIKQLIAQFFPYGFVAPTEYQPYEKEELETIFDSVSEDELADADLVEQKNFVDQIASASEEAEKQKKNTVSQTVAEPVSKETEPATNKEAE